MRPWLGVSDTSVGSDTIRHMTSYIASAVSGVVLAAVAIFSGISAITPGANGPEQTEAVVTYDAP